MNDIPSEKLREPLSVDDGETAQASQGSDDSIADKSGDQDVATLDPAAIARELIESAPDRATIYLILNSGANTQIVGHAGAAYFGFASPGVDQQTISTWFKVHVKDTI